MTEQQTDAAFEDRLLNLVKHILQAGFGQHPNKTPMFAVDLLDENNSIKGFILAVHWDYFDSDDHDLKNLIQNIRSITEERSPAKKNI
jgi:hypothetical protein